MKRGSTSSARGGDRMGDPEGDHGGRPAQVLGGRRLVHLARHLLEEALASDDAEAAGVHADDVLANGDVALAALGNPDAWPTARLAVVQRYGGVGALLVVGYEGRFRGLQAPGGDPNPDELERLLDAFADMDAHEIDDVLGALEAAAATAKEAGDTERARARRWLEATYAVAARDGTNSAHRAYMQALDRVMRLAARRLAS